MPLIHSAKKEAVGENISELRHSGYPQQQAIAIAMSNRRKFLKKKKV